MLITAAVVKEQGGAFCIENCELDSPKANEVLIEVEAAGICHTDIAARDQYMPVPLPAVLGHEGVGRILQLGEGVSEFAIGDRVLMSFGSCGQCKNCRNAAPGYCDQGLVYQVLGSRSDGSSPISQQGKAITGHFFAQSSFASHAVAATQNMVPLADDLDPTLMAPLACGVQTGMGSVLLSMAAESGSSICILGCGTVGLSAIAAAKIAGCNPIIAVDIMDSRLEMARELGASHCIRGDQESLQKALQKLGGIDYALDTTGAPAVADAAFQTLKPRGCLVCVGVGKPGAKLNIDMGMLMATGKQIRGAIEGDAVPRDFIPRMIEYYRAGQLPLDKLVTRYAFEDINQAVADTLSGKVIKPVLSMSN